ncbi:glycosyl hydrolase family 8 [Mucilaginibacter sp. PPCGB 2223]|uniref:glycosyl hydrolase family 8 n=1 Tax=Mucilaginibacter sp. PPCGB 2223 TaxID=1886027 RepID=UPI001586F742|nr:glycosyl hydrolase family 8 [Mucilaginibacter sp. PPCGB 2223]
MLILFGLIFAALTSFAQNTVRPFPQHVKYVTGVIKPSHVSQQQMDKTVGAFYTRWKERYINTGCDKGQDYIWFEKPGNKQCVSEGQGYGMLIVALMAGYDRSAKAAFDGLYRYYKAHPSKRSKYLMAWAQSNSCTDLDGSSATDGDMDIAFSLLLANAQWGSKGQINYLQEARSMIAAIMQQEINPQTYTILLSNAVEHDSGDYFDTRASDFMPAHFKAFKKATADARWDKVTDNTYRLFEDMAGRYSPEAGLVPDFISHLNKKPVPAKPRFLESVYDGAYNYNACRVPWRVGTDAVLYGDKRALAMSAKINAWIRQTTGGNPDNISAGYTLAGNDIKGRYFEAMSFIAPFAVSAMAEDKNQVWLNKLWDYINKFDLDDFDYYDNSIKMIGLLIISGNYWPAN